MAFDPDAGTFRVLTPQAPKSRAEQIALEDLQDTAYAVPGISTKPTASDYVRALLPSGRARTLSVAQQVANQGIYPPPPPHSSGWGAPIWGRWKLHGDGKSRHWVWYALPVAVPVALWVLWELDRAAGYIASGIAQIDPFNPKGNLAASQVNFATFVGKLIFAGIPVLDPLWSNFTAAANTAPTQYGNPTGGTTTGGSFVGVGPNNTCPTGYTRMIGPAPFGGVSNPPVYICVRNDQVSNYQGYGYTVG